MRDNLVFSGILEKADDTIKNITFHWLHCLGGKKLDNQRPRPIVA